MKISDLDIVFITYDEPKADEFYADLLSKSHKHPQRVQGIKGFDAAHREAAKIATTDTFITVDGDNIVRNDFFDFSLNDVQDDVVYSFNAHNTVNGLIYGNGSIKVWPRKLGLNLNSHENSNDFCWTYKYWQVDKIASDVYYNQSPLLSFRAGYREAVKLSLVADKKLPTWEETISVMYPPNLSRLKVWATIGSDQKFGIWSTFGAQCALHDLWISNIEPKINDYEWIEARFNDHEIDDDDLIIGDLEKIFGINSFPFIGGNLSRWFKQTYINYPRYEGLMLPENN